MDVLFDLGLGLENEWFADALSARVLLPEAEQGQLLTVFFRIAV